MATDITPFLMFEGRAEEAMTFYASLFPDAQVTRLDRFGPDAQAKAGTVLHGELMLNGRPIRFFDSPAPHAFSFTPSFSLFVDCEDEAEIDRLWTALSDGGQVMMPLGEYDFSRRFAWVNDRFGVSWQLNLP